MRRLLSIFMATCLTVMAFAVTYPSKPYAGRLHESSSAVMTSKSGGMTGAGTGTVGGWHTQPVHSTVGGSAVSVGLPRQQVVLATAPLLAPQQLAHTTLDSEPTYRGDGLPTTGGDTPENPDLYQPIGSGLWWSVIMALAYLALTVRRRRSQRSSDCRSID